MEKRNLKYLYDLIINLEVDLEVELEQADYIHSTELIKALAAAYELQDYLANKLA